MSSNATKSGYEREDLHQNQLVSVGQIAAGIAHEVRNPLTAVKGFLQLLREQHKDHYIDIAESELNNALSTLNDLLQVSKPDLENEPPQSFSLAVELESLLHLFQDQIYRVEIIKDFTDTQAFVYGKRNQLKKAFFNLLKNAFESIPNKGILTIGHAVKDEQLIVTIEDTGVGIPQEKLSLLGTPFYTTKSEGTGMGLTHVFSVIYDHGGSIEVQSKEHVGTKFIISLPIGLTIQSRGVIKLDLDLTRTDDLRSFFQNNKDIFEQRLLSEAVNVRDKIEEIHQKGNINLLANAHKLVLYIIENRIHELVVFAKQEGVAWAKHALTLAFKLEWVQAIRRSLWDFLYNYDLQVTKNNDIRSFYELEKNINENIDQFLTYFFVSYSSFKDQLIESQRALVEDLSVPIIPLTQSTSILPLIGKIDLLRVSIIEDKVITQVANFKIETLIIDLSGVIEFDLEIMKCLISLCTGLKMMGCKSVVTGLRAEAVKLMIRERLSFDPETSTKGTLQQAISDYLVVNM